MRLTHRFKKLDGFLTGFEQAPGFWLKTKMEFMA